MMSNSMTDGNYDNNGQYMEQEEEWEREGLLDPAWEKQQRKVSPVLLMPLAPSPPPPDSAVRPRRARTVAARPPARLTRLSPMHHCSCSRRAHPHPPLCHRSRRASASCHSALRISAPGPRFPTREC